MPAHCHDLRIFIPSHHSMAHRLLANRTTAFCQPDAYPRGPIPKRSSFAPIHRFYPHGGSAWPALERSPAMHAYLPFLMRSFPPTSAMSRAWRRPTRGAAKDGSNEAREQSSVGLYCPCYSMFSSLFERAFLFSAFLLLFSASLTSRGLISSGLDLPNRFS